MREIVEPPGPAAGRFYDPKENHACVHELRQVAPRDAFWSPGTPPRMLDRQLMTCASYTIQEE